MRIAARGALFLLLVVFRSAVALEVLRPAHSTAVEARAPSAADLVVRDLCAKRIALLGEAPMHGFGKTLEFKVEVARRLVDECHYTAFFIESGAYDFLQIQKLLRSGQPVTRSMLAAAIGGLWNTREVEPLIPYLLEKVQGGELVLGGLDDQLGRGTYAQLQMPADLAGFLQGDEKERCLAILTRHMLYQYGSDAPYGPTDKALILGCLDKIVSGVSASKDGAGREYVNAMIENLKRTFARDFRPDVPSGPDHSIEDFNDRDRSMYANFRWFMARLPAQSKVIVWTATSHAAKVLSGVPGLKKFVPLGSYIRHEFNGEAFALGISAASGSYGMARQPVRPLAAAPANSLEARALDGGGSDVRYLDARRIRELGSVPARALGPDFKAARWGDVLDGLVVIREERPPLLPVP